MLVRAPNNQAGGVVNNDPLHNDTGKRINTPKDQAEELVKIGECDSWLADGLLDIRQSLGPFHKQTRQIEKRANLQDSAKKVENKDKEPANVRAALFGARENVKRSESTTTSELKKLQAESAKNSAIISKLRDQQMKDLHECYKESLGAKNALLHQVRQAHATAMALRDQQMEDLQNSHHRALEVMKRQITDLQDIHEKAMTGKNSQLEKLQQSHATALTLKERQIGDLEARIAEYKEEFGMLNCLQEELMAKERDFESMKLQFCEELDAKELDLTIARQDREILKQRCHTLDLNYNVARSQLTESVWELKREKELADTHIQKTMQRANEQVKEVTEQADRRVQEAKDEADKWLTKAEMLEEQLEQLQDETRIQVAGYLQHTSAWTASLVQPTDQGSDLWLELAGLAMKAPMVRPPIPELRYWRIDDAWGFSSEIAPRQYAGGLMVELFGSIKSGCWMGGSAQEALRSLTKDAVSFEKLNFTVVTGFIDTFLSVAKAKQMVSSCEALTFCIGMYQLIALVKKREASNREYTDDTLKAILYKVVGTRFLHGLEDGDMASLLPGPSLTDRVASTAVVVHDDDAFVRGERVIIKIGLRDRSLRVISRDRVLRPKSGRVVIRAPSNQRGLIVRIGMGPKAIVWWTETASWRGTQTQVCELDRGTEEV